MLLNLLSEYFVNAPTVAAAAYLRLARKLAILPSNNLSYLENFLYMPNSL